MYHVGTEVHNELFSAGAYVSQLGLDGLCQHNIEHNRLSRA